MDSKKFETIRLEQYPLVQKYAYLDTATTGVFSKRARDAMAGFIDDRYNEGMDMVDFIENWEFADDLRRVVADVINSDSDEIFFSGSGSDMLNIFSNGIKLNENANIITTDLSFPSTPYNWMNRVGKDNVRIAKSSNGQLPKEALFALVDENTAVIALCMVENTSGWLHDMKAIGEFCKEKGIYLVVDATQCIGALKIDVKDTNVDFLAVSTYKWLGGVFGVSFAFVSKRVLNELCPTYVGWTGNKNRLDHSRLNFDLSDGANRFETGSLNWIGLKGISEAMKIYLELGKNDVENYILGLTEYLYKRIEESDKLGLVGPFPKLNRSQVVYIRYPEDLRLNDRVLRENGIRAHVAAGNTMRVSMHFYNNESDIDKLISFLDK
ncbi:MAG: aminotransferase class V-fold PLP-dependent enzyme [Gudongella sp.]|jgi:selenocysteine lyase/cysteine desulfurase|nr:aminotransferase class V-fold PLP-dependent enzyme [Gudongella sp.]